MNWDTPRRAPMGFKVRAIQMSPFGGVAVIEDDGRMTAMKEIIIALAGPRKMSS